MRYFYSLLFFLVLSACKTETTENFRNQSVGGVFGTSYQLLFYSERELDFQIGIDSVFAAVNQSLSTYIPTSDISKINQGDSTLVVDTMFVDVFELSKSIHKRTNGYFDPTVGVLVDAWGFGPGKQIQLDSTRVDSLLNFVGFEKVKLTGNRTISKTAAAIRFDFNAIAKGYAIDRLAQFMEDRNIQDYLLEVGGEVVAKGINRSKNKPWAVGIDDPQSEQSRELKMTINLKDRALASSGNYRKFRIDSVTGKRYVHTIDPRTGYAENSNTLAVTILAENCGIADGYATALMAMHLDDALELIKAQNKLDAYIIYIDDNDKTQEFMTDGFKSLVRK